MTELLNSLFVGYTEVIAKPSFLGCGLSATRLVTQSTKSASGKWVDLKPKHLLVNWPGWVPRTVGIKCVSGSWEAIENTPHPVLDAISLYAI